MRKILLCIPLFFLFFILNAQNSPGDLSAAHISVDGTANCTKCHTVDDKVKNEKCLDCHKELNTNIKKNKGYHASSEVKGKECISCHSEHNGRNYKLIKLDTTTFVHSVTGYELKANHAKLNCKACHQPTFIKDNQLKKKANTYLGLNTECISCHKNEHKDKSTNDCERCHTESNWNTIIFDHKKTVFPLTGAHLKTDCNKCHIKSYTNTPTGCISCHESDYLHTSNPNHKDTEFSKDCFICHNTTHWTDTKFDHNKYTRFKLNGRHTALNCNACHTNGFGKIASTCVSCHIQDYNASRKLNHINANLSKDCKTCHTETEWRPSTFDHSTMTSFPLNGKHLKTDCEKCHINNFASTSTRCVSCHLKDYEAAKNPDHVLGNFSKDCQNCHNTSGRSPAKFDHNKYTSFQIVDSHIGIKCNQCHTDGYLGRSTACVSCHLKDYESTVFPNHTLGEFSKDCLKCHNQKNWKPSTFNHNTATSFSLTQGHKNAKCNQCHKNTFAGTPTDCYSCHAKDYTSSAKLNHEKLQISTHCASCHNTSGWNRTDFRHDAQHFPIFSRKHKDKWNTCTECHVNLSDFKLFSCIKCHEHSDKKSIDKTHIKVNNYEYTNSSCYSCHPKGMK